MFFLFLVLTSIFKEGFAECPSTVTCTCIKSTRRPVVNLDCNFLNQNAVELISEISQAVYNDEVWLSISNLNVETIGYNFFQGMMLNTLSIRGSTMTEIHDRAFFGSENTMQKLILNNTRLTNLSLRSLQGLRSLEVLEITHNSGITNVIREEIDYLKNLPIIRFSLEHNNIDEIEENSFASLKDMDSLHLTGNNLTYFPDSLNEKLVILSLNYNHLTEIPFDALKKLKGGATIDLRHNDIETLDHKTMLQFNIDVFLKLEDNPIECDCDMTWIANTQEVDNLMFSMNGWCNGNNTRNGISFKELTPNLFEECYD